MTAGVTLRQLIFDGSYFVGLEASTVYLDISKNILEKTALEIKKNIVSTYSSVLLIEENILFLEQNKKTLEANLNEVTDLFRNGFEEEESVEQLRLTATVANQLRYAKNTKKVTLNMLKFSWAPTEEPLELSTRWIHLLQKTFEQEYHSDFSIEIMLI